MNTQRLLNYCGMGATYVRNRIRFCKEHKITDGNNDLIQSVIDIINKHNSRFRNLEDSQKQQIQSYIKNYI